MMAPKRRKKSKAAHSKNKSHGKTRKPSSPPSESLIGAAVLDEMPVDARLEELQVKAPQDFRSVTQQKKRAMLVAMSQLGTIAASLAVANICRKTHENWINSDPVYAELWKLAREHAADLMEAEARRRAVSGTNRPVFYQGIQCGTIREYSDTLLIFLLKANNPEKFGDASLGMMTGNAPGIVINAQQVIVEYHRMNEPKAVEAIVVDGSNGHGGNGTAESRHLARDNNGSGNGTH